MGDQLRNGNLANCKFQTSSSSTPLSNVNRSNLCAPDVLELQPACRTRINEAMLLLPTAGGKDYGFATMVDIMVASIRSVRYTR
jgi:hypothetical protein